MKRKIISTLDLAIALSFILFFISGCKKNSVSDEKQTQTLNQALVFKIPTTVKEKQLVENLGKVTSVLKILYNDKNNLKEVNAAIFSKTYTDESILLKDLIYQENSRLSKSKKFIDLCQKWNILAGNFAQKFWNEVNKSNDQSFKTFLEALKNNQNNGRVGEYDGSGEVTIYYPYSENYNFTNDPITSLATATADADEGYGDKSFYDTNGTLQWTHVLVNDDYAFNNPTQIIGVNGVEPIERVQDPQEPPPPPPPPGISRVYIGEGVCKHQYDRLISFTGNGGGSEIKYCHLTGYLQPVNQQITTFQDIASVDFSRGDIRNKRLLRTYTVWDDDWAPADLEQVLAIYEEDNTNTVTFNGSIGTTLTFSPGNTGTASIGYNIVRQSQDDIIRELKISRNSYFTGAYQDQGWNFSSDVTFIPPPIPHGWPFYDGSQNGGANVCWTWPYKTM